MKQKTTKHMTPVAFLLTVIFRFLEAANRVIDRLEDLVLPLPRPRIDPATAAQPKNTIVKNFAAIQNADVERIGADDESSILIRGETLKRK